MRRGRGGKPVAEASPRPDILFEDFEHGYEKWKVEGEAFGKEPAHGTLPNQNPVTGFLGQGLVNSYLGGDDKTGRLVSKPFTIERQFIRFLVGGGRHATRRFGWWWTARWCGATSGKDNEQLQPAMWDVGDLQGQTAHIEIVDEQKGGWGHVNVDQIEFSDMPGNRAVMQLLEELLPARFSGVRAAGDDGGGGKAVEFENLVLQPGATQSKASDGTALLTRPVGKGKVVVAAGAVLEPAQAGFSHQRQPAYAFICGLVGATYTGPGGHQHPKAPGFGTLALAALGAGRHRAAGCRASGGGVESVCRGRPLHAAGARHAPARRRRTATPSMARWRRRSLCPRARASKCPSCWRGIIRTNTAPATSGWAAITRRNGPTRGR